MNGVLLVDKPADWTSHDVVAKLRGVFGETRIGHAGTLDPMATGLLVVFLGRATKAVSFAEAREKRYIARLRLGVVTDTQDITGRVLAQREQHVTRSELEAALSAFRGEILQVPPMYSAIKVDGKRLYDVARCGGEVERAARPVTIHRLELIGSIDGDWLLDVTCSKGTYIRTLCHDLGEKLGCGGIMTSLVRTSSGGFTLADCFTFEQIQQARDENRFEELILPIERVFAKLPKLKLNEVQTRMYRNGVKLDLARVRNIRDDADDYAVYGFDGAFIGTALTDRENGILRVAKNLV